VCIAGVFHNAWWRLTPFPPSREPHRACERLSASGAGLFIALEHLVLVLFLQNRKPDFSSFRKCRKAAGMDVIDP
jgi:hypothetical protein